jgi:hypothetical protein
MRPAISSSPGPRRERHWFPVPPRRVETSSCLYHTPSLPRRSHMESERRLKRFHAYAAGAYGDFLFIRAPARAAWVPVPSRPVEMK